ncbi:MAG: valine--tRNA ligase [Candidatus Aenigmatarchaeota archaeon]
MQPKLKEGRWSKDLEKVMLEKWKKEKLYTFDVKAKKIFSIDTPPPYPSGRPWHIGAAAQYSQIDMIARTARAQGYSVLFPIGIDRNGLPVEIYTERKHGIHLQDLNRKDFIKLCETSLDELEAEMLKIMEMMGLSCDFSNYYRTDSNEYRALTQATFIELWKRGLIYEDIRPNNYCFVCGTTIADAEVSYEERPTKLVYIKFKVQETGENIIIATTRPELLCACQVVAVNPADERYKHLIGKHAILPIYGRSVPIIAHTIAKPEFGSGIVMICSYGDYSDVRIFRELRLPEIIAINLEGKMTHHAGPYSGMLIEEARKAIINDMKGLGIVEKEENIKHRTPICERSKTPIEIIPMNEWYLKQIDFVDEVRKISKQLKWHPLHHRQILLNWIDSITIDWPISRRRYYATEIPIWYCNSCGKPNLPEAGRYWRPWCEEPPFKKCQYCGSDTGFRGEERTFDTWMDSSISPLFITRKIKKAYPVTLRPQGKEIIRTWLYYTLLRCWQLTGKSPFRHAWIGGWGVDEKGQKMSKSKGNVIDPIPILEKYGADAFRLWSASEANLGSDFRCSEARIAATLPFLTKLWNVSRFVSMFDEKKRPKKLSPLDRWILYELNELISRCLKGYEDFNFFIPSNAIRDWLWNVFASHYIELVKVRAYSGDASALYTLHACMRAALILLAPITPFVTDYIYRKLYGRSVHLETFPKKQKTKRPAFTTKELAELNSMIWKAKKDKSLSLRAEIKRARIPKKFKAIEKDLKAAHNIKQIEWGEEILLFF